MSRLLTTLLVSFALLTPSLPAHAGDGRYAEVVAQLGLSPDQAARVEEIVYRSKTERVDIQARLQKAKLELRHTLGAATLDEKAVRQATDALSDATSDLVHNRVDQVIALRKVLTAAQFEQLEQIWQGAKGDKLDRLRERVRGADGADGG